MHAYTEHPIHLARAESRFGRGWRIRLYRFRLSWITGRPPWATRKPLADAWRMKLGIRSEFRLLRQRLTRIDVEWLPIPAAHVRKHAYKCPNCAHIAGRKAFQVPLSEAIVAPILVTFGGARGPALPERVILCGRCGHPYHGMDYDYQGPDDQKVGIDSPCPDGECGCHGDGEPEDYP